MSAQPLRKEQPETAASVVNHLVANLGVLHVKLHQYHWHVKGPAFYRLHEKFEELYNEVNQHFDEFAERLLQIGEKPFSTLEEYLKYASIEEKVYTEELSGETMVKNTIKDYETLRRLAVEGIALAGDEGDTVTEDMLIAYKSQIDFHLWTLEAFLGNDVQ